MNNTLNTDTLLRCRRHIVAASGLVILLSATAFAADTPVSPGDPLEVLMTSSACPTFSWSSDSTSGIELMVASYFAPDETVLSHELPAGASSWTPPANRCLSPGQYVWFFRPLDGGEDSWSDALAFEVSGMPTLDEVERARNVLERFISSGGYVEPAYSGSLDDQVNRNAQINVNRASVTPDGKGPSSASPTNVTEKAGGSSAPQGAPVASAAVTGLSNSASVAGVLAGNSANGPDMVLEGSVQGQVSENQWLLDSASPQTFDFSNPSGDLSLRVNGESVVTSASPSAAEPISMFGSFGGHGSTDKTVAGTENFNSPIGYFRNLTVPAGTTLRITRPVAFIAVSGTCDIAGTITTVASGRDGGAGAFGSVPSPGAPGIRAAGDGAGYGMHGGMNRVPAVMAISGAGGGGGGTGEAPLQRGGDGGGAEARGGEGGYPEFGELHGRPADVDWEKRHLMTAGATDNIQFPPGELRTDFFINFLYYPGAGGGGGSTGTGAIRGGTGGDGGGNVYLECRTASFTGVLDVRGSDGKNGEGALAGGGGGGGGGIAVIRTLDLQQNSGTALVSGGLGGAGIGGGGNGGNGRMGVIEIVDL